MVGANMEAPVSAPQRLGNNDATLASLSSPPLMMSHGHWCCHCHHFVRVVFATVAGRGVGVDIIGGRCGGAYYCASACNCTLPTVATMTMTASAAGGQALRRCGGAGASVLSLGGNAIRFSFAFSFSYCREGNSDCAMRTIEKFNVGTSGRLLRHQSTCHSSFNSIHAGSECNEAYIHFSF